MKWRPSPHGAKWLLLFFAPVFLVVLPTSGIDLLVYSNTDSGAGSLRQAIQDNNALGGGNTILFSNTVVGTITLTSGELVIGTNVTILGPGPQVLTLSGSNASRIFNVSGGTVAVSGLTIANGLAVNDHGGGIYNVGNLVLSNCLFTANSASHLGGAVSSSGQLSVDRCAFIENAGSDGGGALWVYGTCSLNNSTIVSNLCSFNRSGGGILNQGSDLTLTSCTIIGNRTGGGPSSDGGGVSGSATVRNTIICSNTAAAGPDVYSLIGSFTSQGYNLIGKTNGATGFGAVGDQLGTTNSPLDAKLLPLAFYAGALPSMPPMSGSLAIDQGKSFGDTTDQLGRPRTYDQPVPNATLGDGTDIGAVEIGAPVSLQVTTTNDSGAGSLRQTIRDASVSANATVNFAPSVTNTITLTSGELLVGSVMAIAGPGPRQLTLSGNNASRAFNITAGTVAISGLTIANGRVPSGEGSGLYSLGTLSISNCLFTANVTSLGSGGAVSSSGDLTVDRCAFLNNQAMNNSGGALVAGGPTSVNNSTFVSNTAAFFGGGIDSESGGLTLTACTFVGNGAGSSGGGIKSSVGSATARSTIIAGNSAPSGRDVSGAFISGGYNFISATNGSTGFGATGDQLGSVATPINANLFPLGLSGGETPTMPPQSGSPAIDKGKNFGDATDQRGRARTYDQPAVANAPGGDGTDIGAVEIGPGISSLVTTTNDSGPGSLRQAVLDASSIELDTVTFAPNVTNPIVLSSGQIVIDKPLSIFGPGDRRLRVSGNNNSRVFNLAGIGAEIAFLTIANGSAFEGGGMLVDSGTHTLYFCEVENNFATNLFGNGGGISLKSNATLNIYNSSVVSNQAALYGGGISQNGSSFLGLYSCTVSDNRLTQPPDSFIFPNGGGISVVTGSVMVVSSTIASNFSTYVAGGMGNGLFTFGTVDIRNSIIAGNMAASAGPDALGPFNSDGFNLIGNSSGNTGFTNTGDQLNVDPLLGPPADYGGPTLTMALRSGSPAIDKGKSFGSPADQRGFPRPLDDPGVANAGGGDGSDIGAFEVDPNFRIVDLRRNGNDVALSLMTVLGRNYRAEHTNDLAAGPWTIFTNNAPGNGWLLWVTNSGGANQPRRFYRGAIVP